MTIVYVSYRKPKDADAAILKLNGDPFEVCARVAAEFDPRPIGPDLEWEEIKRARAMRERKAA